AGWMDAGEAAWNIQLVSTTPPSPDFINRSNPGDYQFINSDLSFTGPYVIQGNFSGVQVWDITNLKSPRLHKAFVCPGSQSDVSGSSGAPPDSNPNSALFRIEVIQVPLAHPEQAKIVTSPRIFSDLAAPARHGELVADSLAALAGRPLPQPPPAGAKPASAPTGPTQCHDITVYPAIGLAGGACGGYGLLLDIRDVANPKRIGAVADSNFSFWHS